MSDVPTVTVSDVPPDAPLIDVREADEWQAGHAARARHLPLTELLQHYGEIPAEQSVYLICRTGGRSARATMWLNQNGFDAVNVAGGMDAWAQAGGELVADSGEPYVM